VGGLPRDKSGFLHFARGAFAVKSAALCEAGGEYFYLFCRRLSEAADKRGFSPKFFGLSA